MNSYYSEFLGYLEAEDKEKCVSFALQRLESREMNMVTLYEEILAPALNNIACEIRDKKLCIWKEHVRSGIVRTIIECSYTHILKERKNALNPEKVVAIICPDGEYHEIGARMVTDFFTLEGFRSIFVGSSTPKEEFLAIIDHIKPNYIAISVTNYYNLVSAKKTIEKIKERYGASIKIIVGGNAFQHHPDSYKDIGADMLHSGYCDVQKLAMGGDGL